MKTWKGHLSLRFVNYYSGGFPRFFSTPFPFFFSKRKNDSLRQSRAISLKISCDCPWLNKYKKNLRVSNFTFKKKSATFSSRFFPCQRRLVNCQVNCYNGFKRKKIILSNKQQNNQFTKVKDLIAVFFTSRPRFL